jgi:hypothetical protein
MTYFHRLRKSNPYHDANGLFTSAGNASGGALALKPAGGQLGSNPGGIHADAEGNRYYVKYYRNPDQARVEELSSKIFGHMGVETPRPALREVNGKQALMTSWNTDLKQIEPRECKLNEQQQEQIGRMYLAAVLTKNWDVAGLTHDNIVLNTKTGDLVEVDAGGSKHFRAQGGPKDYGPDANELTSLRNPANASGEIFNKVFTQNPKAETKAVDWVKNLPMNTIKDEFEKSGLPNHATLYNSFEKRREAILAHYA